MGLEIDYAYGQTKLSEVESEGLKIATITLREELDIFEQQNIQEAIEWTIAKKLDSDKLFSVDFTLQLHKRMYGKVWKWAGKFRQSEKNIGVTYYTISVELQTLLDDAKFWFKNETFTPEVLALTFKHRLVSIHCFPNGNGRHSRLMADLIMEKLYDGRYFTWGGGSLIQDDQKRKNYITALKKADLGNLEELMVFART